MNGRPERIIGAEDDEPGIERLGVRPPGGVATPADWVPFPTDALPPVLATCVTEYASALGVDPSFVAVPTLAMLGSCVGTTRVIRIKRSFRQPCILWAAIVAPSGTRKTPALSAVLKPLHRAQAIAHADYRLRLEEYELARQEHEEARKDWKRGDAKVVPLRGPTPPPGPPTAPTERRFIASDATFEALGPLLSANPRGLLVWRDELAGLVQDFDRYRAGARGGDCSRWLSCWSAEPIIVDRRSSGTVSVPHAALSILGSIQPDVLRRLAGPDLLANGFLARILVAMPPSLFAPWTDEDISEATEERLARIVGRLLDLGHAQDPDGNPVAVELPLAAEAKALWVCWFNANERESLAAEEHEAAAIAKGGYYVARLALLLQLVRDAEAGEQSGVVGKQAMASAIRLWGWLKAEAQRVYGMLGEPAEDRELRRLEDWIRRQGSVATIRDVTRGPRLYRGKPEAAEEAMDRLARQGRAAWEDSGPGPGHPTRRLRLT
jgi:hypothetical protein